VVLSAIAIGVPDNAVEVIAAPNRLSGANDRRVALGAPMAPCEGKPRNILVTSLYLSVGCGVSRQILCENLIFAPQKRRRSPVSKFMEEGGTAVMSAE
jgi:hypothetical protein